MQEEEKTGKFKKEQNKSAVGSKKGAVDNWVNI